MPTNTFFRLPAEKRERLMEACWAEFTRQRFSEVSINRIISAAHILQKLEDIIKMPQP